MRKQIAMVISISLVSFLAGTLLSMNLSNVASARGRENMLEQIFDSKDVYWFTLFEGLDTSGTSSNNHGWFFDGVGNPVVTSEHSCLKLTTNAGNGNFARIFKEPNYYGMGMSWDKPRKLRTRVMLSANNLGQLWLVSGDTTQGDYVGFAFKENGKLYGVVSQTAAGGGQSRAVELMSYADHTRYTLECHVYPHKSIEWYVDDVLKGTELTVFPEGDASYYCLCWIEHVQVDALNNFESNVIDWEFWAER